LKKKIVYIGKFLFPDGNAEGKLVYSNGRILSELGYDLVFIGVNEQKINFSKSKVMIDNFESYSIPLHNSLLKISNYIKINKEIINFLKSDHSCIAAVISYGTPTFSFFIFQLAKFCKAYKIPFIANVVDMSATSHGTKLERIAKFLDRYFLRKVILHKADGVISISNYIKNYFSKNIDNIIVLPPLVSNLYNIKHVARDKNQRIKLVYAGIPFPIDGRKVDIEAYKDRLDITIELLSEVYKSNNNFEFDIYGLSKEQYLSVVGKHKHLINDSKNYINFFGKVNQKEIIKEVSLADFTINLRDVNEMTTAGFSTKFVESISCGTPMITTDTSDLNDYLEEGKNGFFIDINNRNKALIDLNEILSISKHDVDIMKKYCLNSKLFHYTNYINKMSLFIEKVIKG
tara:strand:- start:15779 stop:16984 length:1206 start_codon:yes stop_codon:yes gene_type:complete